MTRFTIRNDSHSREEKSILKLLSKIDKKDVTTKSSVLFSQRIGKYTSFKKFASFLYAIWAQDNLLDGKFLLKAQFI